MRIRDECYCDDADTMIGRNLNSSYGRTTNTMHQASLQKEDKDST